MKQIQRLVAFAALSVVIASPASSAPPLTDYYTEGTQVGVGTCSFADPRTTQRSERLFAALAAAAVSQGVNMLLNAVADAAKAKTWSTTAARNFQTKTADFPQCVQVARGRFYTDSAHVGDWAWAGRKDALLHNGLFLADEPDFFFEGEISASDDQAALAIRPIYSSFRRPIGTRALRPDKSRGIAVFFSITPPGTAANLATAPGATLALGEQQPGTVKKYAAPGPTYRSPMESNWFTLTKADAVKPLTISALVTETQGASAYWDFISKVVGDATAKQQLTSGLNQLFVPGAAAAADAAAATAAATAADNATKAANTADQKMAAAISKLDACRSATNVVTAAAEAKVALRDYMMADQGLDADSRSNLVGDAQIKLLDLKSPSTLKANCGEVYQQLTGVAG